ncbi:MAG: hypothetical protein NVSMB27_42760 [Ktedonobacteraceae bacterium]
MNNEPNPGQWGQPQPTQYDQQQQWAQPQPQWNQQPPNQYQYSNVPAYAQPQMQSDQTSNFLMRFFMMRLAIRIVLLVLLPLLLCGGCAMVVLLASLAHP